MVLGIITSLISVFIMFQSLCYYGVLPISPLVIEKFSEVSYLQIVRLILLNWSAIAGVSCFLVGAVGIFLASYEKKSGTDEKAGASYYALAIIFAIYALFTVI